MQGRGMTEAKAIEYAKEELTCDFVGEVLGASSLMDKFCADIRSGAVERETATGLVGAVKRFLAKITGKAVTTSSATAMRNRIMSMYGANIEQAEKAVREIQKALAQASKQQSNLLNDGVDGATIKENHLRFSNKNWVPKLNSQEWNLLNYTAEKEISSSDKYISETAKWLFADSKGTTVFAVYGIGDGASPTVLYAVGGEKAFTANAKLQSLLEAKNGIIRNRTAFDRVLNDILNRDGNESNGTFNAGNRKTRTGNVQVFAGEREGNGEGYSGESEKNQQRNSISVDNIRFSDKDTAPDVGPQPEFVAENIDDAAPEGKRVRGAIRTAYNNKNTPQEILPMLTATVKTGNGSYKPDSNSKQVERARKWINSKGMLCVIMYIASYCSVRGYKCGTNAIFTKIKSMRNVRKCNRKSTKTLCFSA